MRCVFHGVNSSLLRVGYRHLSCAWLGKNATTKYNPGSDVESLLGIGTVLRLAKGCLCNGKTIRQARNEPPPALLSGPCLRADRTPTFFPSSTHPQSVLDDVNDFRKVALEISKSAAREGKLGEKKSEIMQTMDAGYSRMEDHFLTNGSVLEDLTEIQKSLRSLPIVQLHLPTVVLVREERKREKERNK